MQRKGKLNSKGISRTWIGKTLSGFGVTALIGGTLMLAAPGSALANDCAALSGNPPVGGECVINSPRNVSGVFNLDETLHIVGTGSLTTGGADITINSTGSIVLDPDAFIDADSNQGCPSGRGGDVTLKADSDGGLDGDVLIAAGARVTSNSSCSGGEINIAGTKIDILGLVESEGLRSGSGALAAPAGGGPISLNADCTLFVDDTGKVSSRGRDTGADRVHLQAGCQVKIYGLVESTAIGHHPGPANKCHAPERPDKPISTNACVEIWVGENTFNDEPGVVIDGLTHHGQINADLAINPATGKPAGGADGISWIDIFTLDDILVLGPTDSTLPFAIHANGRAGSNDTGGIVTIKALGGQSAAGIVTAMNRTVQADGSNRGGIGGIVTIESNVNANLNTMVLFARGDFTAAGGFGQGGIANIRSFNGDLNWQNGNGDVRPVPPDGNGMIDLKACGVIVTTGTNFNSAVPTTDDTLCGGAPIVAAYVVFPLCACVTPQAPCVCIESATRNGNLLTIFGKDCPDGGFLGVLADPADDLTLVGFSATCDPNPTCTATVNAATRTNDTIEVTVPACAVPGNFIIVGVDGPFPNPTYKSFSCLKSGLEP